MSSTDLLTTLIASASISGHGEDNFSVDVSFEEYSPLERHTKVKHMQQVAICNEAFISVGSMQRINPDLVHRSFSPSRKYVISFFESNSLSEVSIFNTSTNAFIHLKYSHGPIYINKPPFSCQPSWSADEKYILYPAEMPKDENSLVFYEDLGEKFIDLKSPRLYMIDVEAHCICDVTPQTLGGKVLEAIWVREQILINFLPSGPLQLGLSISNNRSTMLILADIDVQTRQSTIVSRFSSEQDNVNFASLVSTKYGFLVIKTLYLSAHHSPGAVQEGKVIDNVITLAPLSASLSCYIIDELYHHQIPFNYAASGILVAINFQAGFNTMAILINLEQKTFQLILSDSQDIASFVLLDLIQVSKTKIFAIGKKSTFSEPFTILYSCNLLEKSWKNLYGSQNPGRQQHLVNISDEFKTAYPQFHDKTIILEYVIITHSESAPLIIQAHGGPHGSYSSQWCPRTGYFLSNGYAVAWVNYTGSSSYGRDALTSLIGFVGELDVLQVNFAAKDMLKRFGSMLDASKVFYLGGSHGGYIGAWLASSRLASNALISERNLFAAFALLNPVTDLVMSINTSDIPEWALNIAGIDFNNDYSLLTSNKKYYHELWSRSPIRMAKHVNRPILFVIGKLDRRVCPLNAIRFFQALPSPHSSKIMEFPDTGHLLDTPYAETELPPLILSFFKDKSLTIDN